MQAKDGVPGRATQSEESREAAVAAARSASAKQAEGVAILDVHGLIVITDFFVIAERLLHLLDDRSDLAVRREGETEGRWVLLDYVDVVVHVFADEEREYYDLERLWRDAPRVEWNENGAASSSG